MPCLGTNDGVHGREVLVAESSVLTESIAVIAGSIAGSTFAFAGISKLGRVRSFAETLQRFPLARLVARNPWSAGSLASAIAVLEIGMGLFLVLGIETRLVSRVAVALLVTFSLGALLAVIRSEDIRCGCFGSSEAQGHVGMRTLLRNAGLLALALVAGRRPYGIQSLASGALAIPGFLTQLLLISQASVLVVTLIHFTRLRQLPAYVRRVPKPPEPSAEVWLGTPEPHGVRG
jgi:uncharacterized membrane protein YphA (DoxX/SURF4 family)